ncbi:MAG: PDGLE domain-containing protein [Aphanocapsa lilacina HA4352-LM1]|jgi:hypothetical protein|nr:PDGLE domain-containing protein [Aphanocapsa lilacina HA4352-LM1]
MGARGRWVVAGLGLALLVAIVSPLASPDPDGLERVAADQGFAHREVPSWAEQLPFAEWFAGYALRGLADPAAAKIAAGITGTLAVFGLAWGAGAVLARARGARRP